MFSTVVVIFSSFLAQPHSQLTDADVGFDTTSTILLMVRDSFLLLFPLRLCLRSSSELDAAVELLYDGDGARLTFFLFVFSSFTCWEVWLRKEIYRKLCLRKVGFHF